MADKTAVIAIGGNSLIRDRMHQTVWDQYVAARETCKHIVPMIADGWKVAVGHGNGPQVGFILRRSELASKELHEVPLDVCGADTQGAIGYALQQNLHNELRAAGLDRVAATVVTQTQVAADDPAFDAPSKPIGSFMDADQAEKRRAQGWDLVEDANRGYRRVVASPAPIRIVELGAIRQLLDAGVIVISVGGGGIPVVADADGNLQGVAAVIDKDLASAMLATELGAELFIISTAVEKVALHFNTPQQHWVDRMTLEELKGYLDEGKHFAKGSMEPKMQAVVQFLEQGGDRALITTPDQVDRALAGQTGTWITRE